MYLLIKKIPKNHNINGVPVKDSDILILEERNGLWGKFLDLISNKKTYRVKKVMKVLR